MVIWEKFKKTIKSLCKFLEGFKRLENKNLILIFFEREKRDILSYTNLLKEIHSILKFIGIFYALLLIVPYFWHYEFLPLEISLDSLQLIVVFLTFVFISYFLLLGTLAFFVFLLNETKENKNIPALTIGSMFALTIAFLFFISQGNGLIIFFSTLVYFIFLLFLSINSYKGSINLSKLKEVFTYDTLIKIPIYGFIIFVSYIIFLFEIGILTNFSDNFWVLLIYSVIVIAVVVAISSLMIKKMYLEAFLTLIAIPIINLTFNTENHINLLETTFRKFNLASNNARIYVNENIYKLLKEEHKDGSLSLCGNYIETKDGKWYLVENLKVIWNGSKEIIVLTERYRKKQKVPIPKSALLNGDIITEYKYDLKQ